MRLSDFLLGGLASVGATIFTNPLEVVRTRLQLQGELAARGTYAEPYKGVFGAFTSIAKNEGLRGLQKGLITSMHWQFVLNSIRLGIYKTAWTSGWMHNKEGELSAGLGLLWGGVAGITGSFCSSPFFMVKTQLQSSSSNAIAVGHQHKHSGMLGAFKTIYRQGGLFSLWRGAHAAIIRSSIGSSVQIITYDKTKLILREKNLVTQSALNSFFAGGIAGAAVAMAITPLDVCLTRLYNQPVDKMGRGLLYHGLFDCLFKIMRIEGIYGLYKGFWPFCLRIMPHSTLVLLLYEELLVCRDWYYMEV